MKDFSSKTFSPEEKIFIPHVHAPAVTVTAAALAAMSNHHTVWCGDVHFGGTRGNTYLIEQVLDSSRFGQFYEDEKEPFYKSVRKELSKEELEGFNRMLGYLTKPKPIKDSKKTSNSQTKPSSKNIKNDQPDFEPRLYGMRR